MAKKLALPDVSRRERQILDVLYKTGRATVADVQQAMPSAPSYSAVRTLLRILEEKGHIRHEVDGAKYVYIPTIARDKVKGSAVRYLLNTFFEGSTAQAIAALLDANSARLSDEECARLTEMIERARKEGR